ncbi:MAG: hypothetical protein JXR96_25355 [Deltaproteobacteria bacterium]|nr:hypothetical protein [Deltaproteobacteria bacterium]
MGLSSLGRIDRLPGFEVGIPPAFALAVALMGLLILFVGWRMRRIAMIAAGFGMGAIAGQWIARWTGAGSAWGIAVGGAVLAVLADPLHRVVAFAFCGLAAGVVFGTGLALLISDSAFWWGFTPACLLAGLLSIYLPRSTIILASAFLGGLALLWGSAIAGGYWLEPSLLRFHSRHPVATLVIVGLTFSIGCMVQYGTSTREVEEAEEEG